MTEQPKKSRVLIRAPAFRVNTLPDGSIEYEAITRDELDKALGLKKHPNDNPCYAVYDVRDDVFSCALKAGLKCCDQNDPKKGCTLLTKDEPYIRCDCMEVL